ncbi:MAG TPA: heparan-alpha-glucosaminide N-acetyltransferase domain-containing protein [Ohtaekwangia sp.]
MTTTTLASQTTLRVQSIDLLRGLVMIIMALDHVRDYFHADAFLFNPVNLDKTNAAIFATRWITHFCAPVFVFLAGTSAWMVGSRKGKKELSSFLLKRGLWLIVLEFTIINFAWFANIEFSLIALTVIWALAIGMILLAVAIHLPFKVLLMLGVVLVAGHNLLDTVHAEPDTAGAVWWGFLHEQYVFRLGHFVIYIGYPILPWAGVMFLGYCFGAFYSSSVDPAQRRKTLIILGSVFTLLFILIRITDIYGDPNLWSTQRDTVFTFLSFMNVTKYPPSLLYLLVTLGPSIIFLAVTENLSGKVSGWITALGRVPMFYYIVHLYVIHLIAIFAALATGFDLSDMVFDTWVTDSPNLIGYGFSLGVVYLVWIVVVLILFPLCLWYDRYKISHRDKWWLSYL